MSLGHFSYLLSDTQHQMSKVSSERLELLATGAAKQYADSGKSLNETITKIAKENDLNQHQIARVCEMANIATHRFLWQKTAQKESVAFPLADSRQIVSVVPRAPLEGSSCDMPEPVQSSCGESASADYMGPPPVLPKEGPSLMSMLGIGAGGHSGLHSEPESKRVIIILQKKAAERKALRDKILYDGIELDGLKKKAYASVKQAIIGGQDFYQLLFATQQAGLGKIAADALRGYEERLLTEVDWATKQRLEKTAIAKAPEDLISDQLGNITVINGAHPVLVSLDTLAKKTGEIQQGLHNLLRIDDEIQVYNQRLRELA